MTKEDLIRYKKGDPKAKESGRKGGLNNKGKNTISHMLKNRIYCNAKCPVFYSCPVQPLSEKQFKGKCSLKEMPLKFQERTLDILQKGEIGISSELRRAILRLSIKTDRDDTVKSEKDYIDTLMSIKDAIYGKKIKQEIETDQNIEITWKEPYYGENTNTKKRKDK